jgi:hypothetical protein
MSGLEAWLRRLKALPEEQPPEPELKNNRQEHDRKIRYAPSCWAPQQCTRAQHTPCRLRMAG